MAEPGSAGTPRTALPSYEDVGVRVRPWPIALVALAALGVGLAPLPGLPPEAHRTLVILVVAAGLWMTEALPVAVTALLIPVLAVALGVADPRGAFAGFGDPIVFLFLGTFLLTDAAARHGLNARLAGRVLGSSRVRGRPARMLWAVALLGCGLSAWINNTATTALLLPLALTVEGAGPRRLLVSVLLMTSYASSLGGLATPVGTAPNLIGLRLLETATGARPSFVQWCAVFAPLAILGTAITAWWLGRWSGIGAGTAGGKEGASATSGGEAEPGMAERADAERGGAGCGAKRVAEAPSFPPAVRTGSSASHAAVPESASMALTPDRFAEQVPTAAAPGRPWSLAERTLIPVFAIVVLLWITPGILAATPLGQQGWVRAWQARLPETVVPVLGAFVLFLLPAGAPDRSRILDAGALRRVDWSTLLLFGGGLTLGSLMFESGLARVLGEGIFRAMPIHGTFGIVLAAALMGVLVSEMTSNTASASLVVPVVLALALAAGVDPVKPALAATVACSFGFMLPVSTPPNALVYGTGRVRIREMISRGALLDLGGVLLVAAWVTLFG